VKIKVELDNVNKLLDQLRDLGAAGRQVIEESITDLVLDTHANAVQGIERGPKTGRVYETRFWTDAQGRLRIGEERVPHRASAPGQYPASDTGRLASNIRFELPTSTALTGRVGTNIMYGRHLEFGTTKMAARPWLMPSFEKAKVGVEQELKTRLEGKL